MRLNPSLNVMHLRAYGATAYVHIPPETQPRGDKFNVRAKKGHLVGYADGLTYHIWLLSSNTIIRSAFVKFDEKAFRGDNTTNDPFIIVVDTDDVPEEVLLSLPKSIDAPIELIAPDVVLALDRNLDPVSLSAPASPSSEGQTNVSEREILPIIPPPLGRPSLEELNADIDAAPVPIQVLRRSVRGNKGVPPRFDYNQQLLSQLSPTLLSAYAMTLHTSVDDSVRRSHKDAMACPNAPRWRAVEELELSQLRKQKVAHLLPLPPGAKALPSKWAYDIKRNGVYKARFVARGD